MLTINSITGLKNNKKIVMLTAYEYITAFLLEKAGVDIILVGDSLGMVFQGRKETIPVTVDDMIYHTKAVKRGAADTFVVTDMPFMSYQASVSDAKKNAGRIIKESGANAVKIEGGIEIIPQVKAIIEIGIPVMGHIGLQPQSVKKYGGYPVIGKTDKEEKELIQSAAALEKAGVFAITVEKVKASAAAKITKSVSIPVIGIGSGAGCDGQVLVTHDMLGFFPDFTPKFVKQYDTIGKRVLADITKFSGEVRSGRFPGKKHSF
ncbi:MAG: 3-methyl-2-oxobutanoate hydroxymethyltransferase [Candidatus Goldiibacteriota bacterium HGW-Goldbacteria-1]|jgi:3-methyl-2-oxobutanoate hydroxymethyltransferase|nr:MAG: 3-methyl-2-oxobutanoate hydroxymethyltransferase [Candidatus Goldiibacteriota bacterium HGW-Goldbacteria-1]